MSISNFILIFIIISFVIQGSTAKGKKKQTEKEKNIQSDDTNTSSVYLTPQDKSILIIENIPEKFSLDSGKYKIYELYLKYDSETQDPNFFMTINSMSKGAIKIDIRLNDNSQIFQQCEQQKYCILNSSNLVNVTTVHFQVNCMELTGTCSGTLEIKFKNLNQIEPNKAVLHKFFSEREEIFKFFLASKDAYSRYMLKLTYLNQHQMKKTAPVEVAFGQYLKASEKKTAIIGNMQLLSFMINDDNRTLNNYDYTFNLTSSKGALVEIMILTFQKDETEIILDRDVYDFSKETKNNNYILKIPQYPNTTNYYLQFQLVTISGDYKSVYVDSVDNKYSNFTNYKWKIDNQEGQPIANEFEEYLTIDKPDIESYMKNVSTFHIVIAGSEGIFQLSVKLRTNLLKRLPIGQQVHGELNAGQTQFYEMLIFKMTEETKEKDYVQVNIQMKFGRANVYGFECTSGLFTIYFQLYYI